MLHLSLLSMNSLNKTKTAIFTLLLHLLLPGDHITRIHLCIHAFFFSVSDYEASAHCWLMNKADNPCRLLTVSIESNLLFCKTYSIKPDIIVALTYTLPRNYVTMRDASVLQHDTAYFGKQSRHQSNIQT